ncbi:SDR family oxidoreductase [Labrys wisconsinensis]|uniref:NAD(P)-dependent dehydrogenase (Short-subunit alcohol dehydrogenase family) n=1 Tax=Labrys wisconsinensis TaxID=425677 RepID=A0ABU0JFX3_9HYPH|nr:SDR family oxidoreductase [Labrys wisconsinensis]MDQ0473186.1 NAD(P)-dependent dehydrogenase (short-subunit alcohol dehydrogenase family) [Labrys wisconsinensis]
MPAQEATTPSDLAGQVVAVVGASSGIGLAAVRAAAGRGARVVMLARSAAQLQEAARGIAGDVQAVAMDMLDRSAVERAIGGLARLDHLVLTAVADELARRAPVAALTDAQVERSFDRLRGYICAVRAAAPRLAGRGSITMVNGASAVKPPRQGFSLLAAENASILGFGRALALELSPQRVNVVMAGVVDTPIHAGRREQVRAWAESEDLPARRFGQPDDLAQAILFLMTNPYSTGAVLTVDGGLTAT